MGNEISGRQTEVSNKYGIDLNQLRKWYHEHYINFLKDEIQKKTWQNGKYEKHMKDKDGKTIHKLNDKFCKWKDIQREIFEATLDNHRFLLYSWEERAKKFIDEAEVDNNFSGAKCDNDDKKSEDDENSATTPPSTPDSSGQNIDLKGCLPSRRKNINKRLYNVRNLIENINKGEGSESSKAQIAATTVIGSLALQTENEIDEFINKSSHNTEHVCKLLGRTYADYKDISKGTDIVENNVTKEVKELLKKITTQVGGEGEMEILWKTHFKDKIEEKLKEVNNSKKGSNTQKSCTLDHSDETKPQCLRYMEEYLEEFLEEKKRILLFLEKRCKNKRNQKDVNCNAYCIMYSDFLKVRKDCYNKYKKQCKEKLKDHNQYGKDSVYETEIQNIEKKVKDKSACNTCGSDHNVNLNPLFHENNPDTNKSYYCHCGEGKTKKDEPPCSDQHKKSSTMSLAGKWQDGISVSKRNSVNNPCELDWKHHSVGGFGLDPCAGVSSNSSWNCNDIVHDGICMPPRRHEICISNIRRLREGDISKFNSDKLLLEIMLAAKQQTWRIRNHNHGRKRGIPHNVCRDIKLSFLDFGDIIKGTDRAKDEYSKETENNLKEIFENIRKEWLQNGDTKYDDSGSYGLSQLRSDWWEKNKTTIWEAFNCNGKTGNACGGSIPQDNRSQFLRWFDEWATEFCSERKTKEQLVEGACRSCGNDECEPSWTSMFYNWFYTPPPICDCKNQCKIYSNWIHDKKKEFDTQKKYYDEKITSMDFGNNDSGGSTSGTSITSVSDYLKEKVNNCGKDVDFNDVTKMFSSYPDDKSSHYRHYCSRCYPQLEADLADKGGPKNDVCAVDQILTKESSNITHDCGISGSSPTKKGDDTEWSTKDICNINISSNGDKVAVPPRYDDICKDTIADNTVKNERISSHDFYYNNRMLLSEFILVARHEGKSLREHYKGRRGGTSSGQDDKSILCTAMRRSFADIADIVRGTNLVDTDDTNKVEQHLKDMFKTLRDKYKELTSNGTYEDDDKGLMKFRKHWWETNRHMIWEAMKCGGKHSNCDDHMNMDKVPQLLRWITEWSETFCKAQKEQYTKLKGECDVCNSKGKNGKCKKDTTECQRCKTQCDKYKEFITKWHEQWKTYEKMYNELYKKGINISDTTTDDNALYMSNMIRQNNWLSPTAATYIHSMYGSAGDGGKSSGKDVTAPSGKGNAGSSGTLECLEQKVFGNISGSNYVFKDVPDGFSVACKCGNDTPQRDSPSGSSSGSEPKKKKPPDICDTTLNGINYERWVCDRTDDKGNKVCKKKRDENNSGSDEFDEFFNEWMKSFLDEYNKFKENVKECTNGNTRADPNACPDDNCKDKCYCYNKWINRRKHEWKLQKQYYDEYKNKTSHYGTLSDFLGELDMYLSTKFQTELGIDEEVIEGGEQKFNDKINDAIQGVNKCVNLCPKLLSCKEKGFDAQWECDKNNSSGSGDKICIKTGDEEKYEKKNMNKVDAVNKFYDTFNYWLDDMERTMDEYLQILEQSCHSANKKQTTRKQGTTGTKNNKECILCKDDCGCYYKWKEEINKQWTKQKEYYNTYQNKHGSQMKGINLDLYLEAKCELDTSNSGSASHNVGRSKKYCQTNTTPTSGGTTTMFDNFLETIDNKKEKICQKCTSTTEDEPFDASKCTDIEDAKDCMPKNFDGTQGKPKKPETTWKCQETSTGGSLDTNVCVPPRGQKLCIANMHNNNNPTFNDEKAFLPILKSAIKKESKLLWEEFVKNGTDQDKKEKACRYTQRSFNDFKNFVLGQSLWKNEAIKNIEEKIKEIIEKDKGGQGGGGTATTREEWWKSHEIEFWNAVKCGIKQAKVGNTGMECPRFIHDDDYDTQFYWWFREWGDDFCNKKKVAAKKVKDACKEESKRKCGNGNVMEAGECKNACEDYKKLIQTHKPIWDKFSKHFDKEEETKDEKNKASYYNSSFYLLFNCDDCNGTNFGKVFKDSNTYGDYQTTCTCISSTSSQQPGGSTTDVDPCDTNISTSNCRTKNKNNQWNTTMIKNPDKYKVYGPPRRQKLCLGNLYGLTGGENPKESLEKELYGAVKMEATFLRQQYGVTNGTGGPTNTVVDTTAACNAMKRSFYDFGDIIKGTDMMKGPFGIMVEKELNEVFKDDTNTISDPDERKKWWENHKDKVWKAMNCDNTCGGTTPNDEKPQFLRWLDEWAEQICKEKKEHIKNLEHQCKNGKNQIYGNGCDKATTYCKKQCKAYNDWINTHKNEWKGQKTKYQQIYDIVGDFDEDNIDDEYKDYVQPMNGKTTAMEYILSHCKDKNLDDVFKKIDQEYKEYEPFCTECRIKDIVDTVKKKQNSAIINPCVGTPSGTKPDGKTTTSVRDIAKTLQETAKKTMEKNSVESGSSGSESKLKGNAEKGEYSKGGTSSALNDLCSITNEHSNDGRKSGYNGPCTGKDGAGERFNIETKWDDAETSGKPNDIFLPPRREHICTSNLENLLNNGSGPLLSVQNDKYNHSFLGDVLLAANKEAEWIKNKYKNPNDNEGKCRAMKYSFADIGDIVRGKDLWNHTDQTKLQGHLQKIFAKIKEQNGGDNGKYKDDNSPYKQLRQDWWEANREQVWEVMKCPIPSGSNECNGMPVDDYIPQRLRWMTEWAEWFCKAQKDEYEKLMKACVNCKGINTDGKCPECAECKAACGTYKNFINKWRLQWEKQRDKYKELYDKAKENNTASGTTDDKDKNVVEFLKQLHEKNNENTTYSTAAGYVHQELKNMDCNTQKVFCNNDASGAPLSNGTIDEYAFRDRAHEYDTACDCEEDTKPVIPPSPQQPPAQPPATPSKDSSSPDNSSQGGSVAPDSGSSNTDPDSVQPSGGSAPGGKPSSPAPDSSSAPAGPPDPSAPGGGGGHPGSGGPSKDPQEGGGQGGKSDPASSGSGKVAPDGGGGSGGKGGKGKKNPGNKGGNSGGGGSGTGNWYRYNPFDPSKKLYKRPKPPYISDTELEACPPDEKVCSKISTSSCHSTKRHHDLDDWNTFELKERDGRNQGVIIPPRRQNICFKSITSGRYNIKTTDALKNAILKSAASEAKYLSELYGNNSKKALEAMKYSFADIGNIIKGDDMVDDMRSQSVNVIFGKIYSGETQNMKDKRKDWWEKNKKHVWHAMLCGYKQTYNVDIDTQLCTLPTIEKDDQFLRWLTEWSQQLCIEKVNEAKNVVIQKECLEQVKQNGKSNDTIMQSYCKNKLDEYRNWYAKRKDQWKGLREQYTQRFKNGSASSSGITQPNEEDANEYVKKNCNNCDCNNKDFDNFLEEQENKKDKELLETLSKMAKTYDTEPPKQIDPFSAITNLVENIKTLAPVVVNKVIPNPENYVQGIIKSAVDGAFTVAAKTKEIVEKMQKRQEENASKNSTITPTPVIPIPPSTSTTSSPEIIVGPVVGAVAATILGILLYKVIIFVCLCGCIPKPYPNKHRHIYLLPEYIYK